MVVCVSVCKAVKSIHTCQCVFAVLLDTLPNMCFSGLKTRVQTSLRRQGDDN